MDKDMNKLGSTSEPYPLPPASANELFKSLLTPLLK